MNELPHTPFFCFGPPKSGTTLLQRCLNAHPRVVCPSEHQLSYVADGFRSLFSNYNRVLSVIDRRTGGQGANLVSSAAVTRMMQAVVEEILQDLRDEKSVVGINDNSILHNLSFFLERFPDAKYLVILRHPISKAISAWHHNHRLAKEENEPRHLEGIKACGGDLPAWVIQNIRLFRDQVRIVQRLQHTTELCRVVRFEDLVGDKPRILEEVFQFLEVEVDRPIINKILHETDFERMRQASPAPHFFRKGSGQVPVEGLDESLPQEAQEIAGEELDYLGYSADGVHRQMESIHQ